MKTILYTVFATYKSTHIVPQELTVQCDEDGESITLEHSGTNIMGDGGLLQVVYNPHLQGWDQEQEIGGQEEATQDGDNSSNLKKKNISTEDIIKDLERNAEVGSCKLPETVENISKKDICGKVKTNGKESEETTMSSLSGIGYVLHALRSKEGQMVGEVLGQIKSDEDNTNSETETEVGTYLQQSIAEAWSKTDVEVIEDKVLETETSSQTVTGAVMCEGKREYINQSMSDYPGLYAIKEECEDAEFQLDMSQLNIYTAMLVHIKDAPFCLWMQRQEDKDLAEYVHMRLEELRPEDLQPVKQPKISQVCLSLYNGSRQRVAIASITGEVIGVQFIDHGRYGSVSHANLWELKDELADIKPLIFQAFLPVKIITGKESGAVLAVAEAALSQTCVCLDLNHLTPLRTRLHTLVWTPGTGDLADLLVSNGLATPLSWEQEVGLRLAPQVKQAMQNSVFSLLQENTTLHFDHFSDEQFEPLKE